LRSGRGDGSTGKSGKSSELHFDGDGGGGGLGLVV